MEGLRVDALTLDAHKMQGPKGVGLLALRRGVPCGAVTLGGGQERGLRPTTESLDLVVGFVEALKIAHEGREKRTLVAIKNRDFFLAELEKAIPDAVINGSLEKRIPNNINISLPNLSDPEFAVLKLDRAGIACSTKSSCLKGEENSYVVATLGGPSWRAKNTLRLSLDPDASTSDVRRILSAIRAL